MANVKITDLGAYTNPASTDVLPIVDVGADVTKKVSIADLLENAGSGTAAAPGIAFDGDPDTGIYRPGADQVAISTNGTGRLFVDASGNVGIGTTSPANPLEINLESSATWTSGETLSNTTTNNNINALRLYNASSAANAETSLLFMSGDSGTAQHSITVVKTGNNAGYLVFRRRAITASAESLRIDNAGRLLVGTSSDSGGALLQVNDNRIRVATAKTPASASATGTTGEICWDASYVYVCTATNTWKRAALATW